MRKSLNPDYPLLVSVSLLIVIGLMMMHSAGLHLFAMGAVADAERFFVQQLKGVIAGVILGGIAFAIDYRKLKKYSVPMMLVILAMLVMVNVLQRGRWLLKTEAGMSFQPSELARMGLIIYIAHWLSSRWEALTSLTEGLVPFSIIVGLVAGLVVLQRDLSMSGLIALTAVIMFFVAGADLFQWAGSLFLGGAVAASVIQLGLFSYAQRRLLIWEYLRRFIGGEYIPPIYTKEQPFWALECFVSGGVRGKGLGEAMIAGLMRHTLPSDGVMALVGEELGLLGCLGVLSLLGIVIYRGFAIAHEAPDLFGKLIAAGVTWGLLVQALLHMGSLSGAIPLTGMTFPFMSLGGSSMMVNMAGIGLLLSIHSRSVGSNGGKKEDAGYDYRRGHRRPRLSRSRRGRGAGG